MGAISQTAGVLTQSMAEEASFPPIRPLCGDARHILEADKEMKPISAWPNHK
jgi:hypothetical protein